MKNRIGLLFGGRSAEHVKRDNMVSFAKQIPCDLMIVLLSSLGSHLRIR